MGYGKTVVLSTISSLTPYRGAPILKLVMKRWWTDSLFLFAVLAGAIFEFVYVPIYMLARYTFWAAARVGDGARRRTVGYSPSGTALSAEKGRSRGFRLRSD